MRFRNPRPVLAAVAVAELVWVATGYRFFPVPEPYELRDAVEDLAAGAGLLGTVLVAAEGVNLSLAGTAQELDAFESGLVALCGRIPLLRTPAPGGPPFRRLRVRLRPEIVALGRTEEALDFAGESRVDADRWEKLLDDPSVPVIDVRNRYEVAVGRFEGALDPGTDSFREFPDWVDSHLNPEETPDVAIYCTGGIRCTKAAAWMRSLGFRQVHELSGGILAYLAARTQAPSRWRGECFVFDDRVGLAAGLEPGELQICHVCGDPLMPEQHAARNPLAADPIACSRSECPVRADQAIDKESHA